jgi:glycosyltransferase involved in cell wall biosynthesis
VPDVTLAIVTWNRAAMLRETLARLARPSGLSWELLVVDNGSTDDTAAVLAEARDLPLRTVRETRPGVAAARQRAVDEARAPLLVFVDDDVDVPPGFLEAYAAAAARHPDAAFFGGPVRLGFLAPPPVWLARGLDAVANAYARIDLGPTERPLRAGEVVHGVNMAFRAAELRAHPFDEAFGLRAGEPLLGEETELQRRLVRAGRSGVWVPAASLLHRIPPQRATLESLARYFRALGRSEARERPPRRRALAGAHALFRALFEAGPRYLAERALGRDPASWLRAFRRAHYLRGRAAECLGSRIPRR